MNRLEIIIVFVLAAWFAATVFYQMFPARLGVYTARFDIFRLLPSFRLFDGKGRDLSLFYRERLSNGEIGEWRKIPLFERRRWFNFLWNHESLTVEQLASLTDDLANLSAVKSDVSERFIYRGISRILFRRASPDAVAGQFRIDENNAENASEKTVFCSEFHQL